MRRPAMEYAVGRRLPRRGSGSGRGEVGEEEAVRAGAAARRLRKVEARVAAPGCDCSWAVVGLAPPVA